MTTDEFRGLSQSSSDNQLVTTCLTDDETPYVFETNDAAWGAFRSEIAAAVGVAPENIRVVGSARFGFSLKPGNNLRSYADSSDIDLVVVGEDLFDRLWLALLRAFYPRPPFTTTVGGWLKERQKEVYTGWLTPMAMPFDYRIHGQRVKEVLDIRFTWFTAMKNASRHPVKRHEDISARLYRTWRHAELYHLHSVMALRKSLAE